MALFKKKTKTETAELSKEKKQRELKKIKANKSISLLSYKRILPKSNILEHEEDLFSAWYHVDGRGLKTMSTDRTNQIIANFDTFLKKYTSDIKIIISQFPLETYKQEQYWKKKVVKEKDANLKIFQQQKATQLERFSKNRTTQEYTLVIYGETLDELKFNQDFLRENARDCLSLQPLNEEKIENLLFFINNPNQNVFNISEKDRQKEYSIDKYSEKEQRKLQEAGYDLPFLKRTQPQGNIKFNNSYIATGNGTQSCITFYDYPASDLHAFWFIPLISNQNTISMIDIGTSEKDQTLRLLRRSTGEQLSRIDPKASPIEQKEAIFQFQTQDKLMNDLIANRVSSKIFKTRIYVHEKDVESLESKIEKIKKELNGRGFKATNFLLGEQYYEFLSMHLPISKQDKLPNKRRGQHISSEDLAGSYFFNHMSLHDPTGSILGITNTGGAFLFDLNHRDDRRTRSTLLSAGNARMGKSTLSKKLIDDNACRGNFIRTFSVNDEYDLLTKYHNGQIIRMDGSEGAINIFEIFSTATLSDGQTIDEIASFNANINKLDTIFQLKAPNTPSAGVTLHGELLTDFYINDQHMWYKNPQQHKDKIKVTGLPSNQYPLLEEWLVYLRQQKRKFVEQGATVTRLDYLDTIISTYQRMLTQEGNIFNQYTTITDFENLKFVNFDFSSLKAGSQETFNAQLFNALFLVNSHAVNNGKTQRQLLRDHKITNEDVQRYLFVMDEAQNFLKSDYPQSAIVISTIMEEMGKYFAGIIINLPSIQTILPTELESSNPKYLEALRKIFGLLQYRVFFQTDSSAIGTLTQTLKGSMNKEELSVLPRLIKSECLININGDQNIQFRVLASEKELERFDGGE